MANSACTKIILMTVQFDGTIANNVQNNKKINPSEEEKKRKEIQNNFLLAIIKI